MSNGVLKSWKFWLGITLSSVFLVVAFWGIDFGKLGSAIRHVSILWILVGICAYYFNLGVRAFRWGYIFRHVKKVGFLGMTGATIVGYFANNVLPMRLGEVGRAIYIGEKENVDKSAALGTIAVERIFDGLSALVILAMAFWLYPFPEEMIGQWSGYFRKAGMGLMAVSVFGLAVLIFMVVKRDVTMRMVEYTLRPFPEKSHKALSKLAYSFIDGLKILSSPLEVLLLVVMSAAVWITNLLPVYFSGLAFTSVPGLHFSLLDTLLVLVSGMVAAAIPASPGFVGTFHYANKMVVMVILTVKYAAGGLDATGIQPAEFENWALSYAVIVHALYIITTTVTGAIILSASGVGFAKIREAGGSGVTAAAEKEGEE